MTQARPCGMLRSLIALGLLSATGCVHLQTSTTQEEQRLACQDVPKCCRDHVYVFMIHGLDPFDIANLHGLNKFVQDLGFCKTWYGQLYHAKAVEREVRRVHAEDPEAHFVLLGFSFGANMVRNVAQAVKDDGITIDLLVYLGGNTLKDIPRDRPENVRRLVNILAAGCIWNGDWFEDAVNIHVSDVWHFGSPFHPLTRETLAWELATVGAGVPAMEPAVPKAVQVWNTDPRPASLSFQDGMDRDEWDFLKPVSRLEMAREAPRPTKQPEATVAKPAELDKKPEVPAKVVSKQSTSKSMPPFDETEK